VLTTLTCACGAEEMLLDGKDGVLAFTRPSRDATLSFVTPGLVDEVLVEDGDHVAAGQVLIRLDDQAEQVNLALLKATAEDEIRIQAAQANLDLKTVQLEKMRKAALDGGATELEVREAEVSKQIQELTLANERFQREQDGRKYQSALLQIERMKVVSPIAGVVEGVAVEPGESAEAYQKVIRVVRIDPLWIDVPVSLARAREQVTNGQTARVALTRLDGTVEYAEGKVIKVSSVADAASDTLAVRVEMPNPRHRPAGEHVRVSFPKVVEAPKGAQAEATTDATTAKEK
jgi:RND family efflux transporter MFP subunit